MNEHPSRFNAPYVAGHKGTRCSINLGSSEVVVEGSLIDRRKEWAPHETAERTSDINMRLRRVIRGYWETSARIFSEQGT